MNDQTGIMNTEKLNRDLPKVEGAPKPQEPMVWTVYNTPSGELRARFHAHGKFDGYTSMDGILNEPRNVMEALKRMLGE